MHKHSLADGTMHISVLPHTHTDTTHKYTVTVIHYILLDVLYLFIDFANFKGQSVYLIPLQYKPFLPIPTSDTDDTSL